MKMRFQIPDLPQVFQGKTQDLIRECNSICSVMKEKGYTLTVRQLFYQLVTRGKIDNTQRDYKNLINHLTNARYAGELDWDYIDDRIRVIHRNAHWDGPEERLQYAAMGYGVDTWPDQKYRPEVWIEKDALIELAENVCVRLDVPYIAVKAYGSTSALWEARKRFLAYIGEGQMPLILHLGDHDYTGVDCSRFLKERMEVMVDHPVELRRLALNPDQIAEYELPAQPGKAPKPGYKGDPRHKSYFETHKKDDVWELDALDPEVIERIIEDGIRAVLDEELRQEYLDEQSEHRQGIESVAENWDDVQVFLADPAGFKDYRDLVSNGHRDTYETWRLLSALGAEYQEENKAVTTKSTIADFHRPTVPPTTDQDAEIAEEYAAVLLRAQDMSSMTKFGGPRQPSMYELAQRLSAKWREA